ncbi:MAG TPA: stage V sporulation protein K [Clostridiales bacterium]|nr:stage V sporulation protein K [Clostridiales bacterium]
MGKHWPPGAPRLPDPGRILESLERGEIGPAEAFARWRGLDRPPAASPSGRQPSAPAASDVLSELDSLIGLAEVKRLVREIRAFALIQARRAREGLAAEATALHMIFRGNPGTGKTIVARLLGKILHGAGVLESGHVVEVERADLVGQYVGHTAQRTREQIRRASGGLLFIDEAYSLARGGDKDFGREAIDTLVKAMEDRKDFIVILAGYRLEMRAFVFANPGLRSRFPLHLDFPDYTGSELLAIADLMLREREYRLDREAHQELARRLEGEWSRAGGPDNAGNARLVRNLIEQAMRRQASRLLAQERIMREDLLTITRADLGGGGGRCGSA